MESLPSLCSLRLSLFHDAAEVRAASLRAIRYYLQSKNALHCLLELNLQHLISRSLDIVLENRIERVQALRLIRHILSIDPNIFPLAFGRCLCAIAGDNSLEKDLLLRACWATIAELTAVNAVVSARTGCIIVMVKCALNSAIGFSTNSSCAADLGRDVLRDRVLNNTGGMSMYTAGGILTTNLTLPHTNIAISEAILSSFLHLYNWPDTRQLLQPKGSDLFYFISPFTDTYSFLHASNATRNNMNPFDLNLLEQLEMQKQSVDYTDTKLILGHNRPANKQQQQQQQFANYEFRTLRYLACKNALLSILRSWPGMFFMCRSILNYKDRFQTGPETQDNLWDYSEIYRQTGEQNIRFLLDSLRFFGIPDQIMPTKVTQMVSGIGKAMGINCEHSSTYFTTTSYDYLNPLESLISIFHLPYPEVHRHLLELIFELFGIKSPDWSENFDEVLRSVYFTLLPKRAKHKVNLSNSFESSTGQQSKNYFPEEWQLYDGFVTKEAEHILPCLSKSRLNFITNYYALLLQVMVEFGLLEGLVSVILDSTDKAAVNLTTILLGELLHLSGKYLPASSYAHRCQSLPTLVAASISDCKSRRNRALMTITRLNQIHELKKRRPKPASLCLEQQLYFCQSSSNVQINRISHSQNKANDDNVISLIKSSLVLKKNYKDWNWDIVTDVLKNPGESLRKLEDKDNHRIFIRRLLDFFRPSRRIFSMISKNNFSNSLMSSQNQSNTIRNEPIYVENPRLLCLAATYFIDFLLSADENRSSEFIEEFLIDLDTSLKNITTKSPSADEILLPSRLLSTVSHHYFLLIGRFTHTLNGRRWLEKTNIYQYLLDLISLVPNDIYMKLIVSSLDQDAILSRNLLSKVLTSTPESSRLYATQYLRVLLRARVANFSHWAIDFLIIQLFDRCSAVSLTAMDILDEACAHDEICLEKVISHRPTVLHLGDNGITFLARFASHPVGLSYLKESNMLENELSRWQLHFSARYVRIVEDSLYECFSCHQRSEYGTFGRRTDKRQFPNIKRVSTTFVPPHIYGQLAQTDEGLQILNEKLIVPPLVKILKDHIDELIGTDDCTTSCLMNRSSEANILRIKAALWSIGHICTSEKGLDYVIEREEPLLLWFTTLIQRCPVLSLRATTFYTLCLISSTRKGAQVLSQFGWTAIQHSHNNTFPLNQQEYDNFYYNGRPLFMSDSEKILDSKQTNVSISSNSLFTSIEDQTVSARQFSQSSSRSSSSSYLSMQAPVQNLPTVASKFGNNSVEPKLTFTLPFSSSSTSIYSNTSSIGCLTSSNVVSTSTYNRPRSSSDCVPRIISNLERNSTHKMVDSKMNIKPEYQDSGILDQTHQMNGSKQKKTSNVSTSPSRNRKISAPCFAVTTENNRENRSDSNDSSRTNNTALYSSGTGSRSTSFAEYSTSSSGSNVIETLKMDRNVSFSPETSTLHSDMINANVVKKEIVGGGKFIRNFNRSLSTNRQMQNDDPYPSAEDAHGYAQLRAIQKRRVQSLSENMFFSGIGNPNSIIDHYNLEQDQSNKLSKLSNRPHSNSLKSDEMPEILITDLNKNNSSGVRQRKTSHISLSPTSPIDTGDLKRLLRIPSFTSIEEQNQLSVSSRSFNRSFSRFSKGSMQSMESIGILGRDDLSLGDGISVKNVRASKDNFMCLCLPESLSFIFHIDEVCVLFIIYFLLVNV